MGEVEKTMERLNKVLVEAGFPIIDMGSLGKGDDYWYLNGHIVLRFDMSGNFIKPENGECDV